MTSGAPVDRSVPGPLFVVGPSRSGTSLVRAILNRHPDVALAGETHYFDDLRVRLGGDAPRPLSPEQRVRCEEYFLRLSHRPYGHGGSVQGARVPRAELQCRADALGGSADAHFQAYCQIVAEAAGASIWGDKTPRHIFRIGEILAAYPSAKVVAMVRDPRSVVLSYRDWKNDQGGFDFERDPEHRADVEHDNDRARRSYDLLLLSLLWRSQARAALEAMRRFGPERVRTVRYEDVVADFAGTVGALAAWVGVEYQDDMANVPLLNSSFSAFEGTAGVSRHSMERWKSALSTEEVGVIQSTCGSLAGGLGYQLDPARASRRALLRHWATLPIASSRAVLANRSRLGRVAPYIAKRAGLALRAR